MIVKIGFTGTRKGLTDAQREALQAVLHDEARSLDVELHHGDCVGADAEAHSIATWRGWITTIHPPTVDALRALCEADHYYPPLPYLQRNRAIVDATEVLVACPGEEAEALRGGTWATVRYARSQGRRVILVLPSGAVERSATA